MSPGASLKTEPYQVCNSYRALFMCSRSWIREPIWSNQSIQLAFASCLFAKQAAFKKNVNDCLARNQDSLSEWSNMFTCELLFQRPSTIKIQLIVLV